MRLLSFLIPLTALISFGHLYGPEVLSIYLVVYTFFQFYLRRRRINNSLGNGIWLIVFSLGIVVVSLNYWTYGHTFGPYRDDSMYYYNIQSLALGNNPYKFPTLYEITMAPLYFLLNSIFLSVSHISLLLINWLFAVLIVLESVELVKLLTGLNLGSKLIIYFPLLFNSIFLDSVLNLYRDGMLIYLMLLGFRYGYIRSYKKTFVAIILVFLLRPASAVIMLLVLFALSMMHKSTTSLLLRGLVVGSVVLFIVAFLDSTLGLGGYMRSVAGGVGNISISELYQSRTEVILNVDEGSGSETIRKSGLFGQLLSLIPTIFAPLQIQSFTDTIVVDIFGVSNFQYSGITTRSFLSILGVLNTIVTAPLVALGVLIKIRKNKEISIVLAYILIVIFVAFISFQARHRLMFMIFHPYFAFYGLKNTSTDIKWTLAIYIVTLMAVLTLHI